MRVGGTNIDESGAEIAAFDPDSARLFVVNGAAATLDILDLSDPTVPTLVDSIPMSGGGANSVAVHDGIVAVAVEADIQQDPGTVMFLDTNGAYLGSVEAGPLPDMVTFTPNGRQLLVANEGEPSSDYTYDPDGSITIVDLTHGPAEAVATHVTFDPYLDDVTLDPSVRVFGPGADAAADFEPEYITVSHDSQTAWVTLQENNAIAIIDVGNALVTGVVGLGFKDHSVPGNALDPSNVGGVHIENWPVHGIYMPDAIASFRAGDETFLLTANEGDARDYEAFSEETRVRDVTLDPAAFENVADLQEDAALGRLKITTTLGDLDDDGDYDELYAFGARSFSVRDAAGALVWDSGDEIEQLTANLDPNNFNANNTESGADDRSDDKGPEAEGLCVGKVAGHTYAFVGLERTGGIVTYDLADPRAPSFAAYETTRDTWGDLGPEGLLFISEDDSPNGVPLLVVSYEVSGSVSIYEVRKTNE